jgi:hypothetical protein
MWRGSSGTILRSVEERHVSNRNTVRAHGIYHFITFGLLHLTVICALRGQQWLADVRSAEQR